MDQKIGIKIESPEDEQIPLLYAILLTMSLILIFFTLALLIVEFLKFPLLKYVRFW